MSGHPPKSPSSPPARKTSSISQSGQHHAPLQPSGLREAHTIVGSPDSIEYLDGRAASSAHPSPLAKPTHIEMPDDSAAEDDGPERGRGILGLGSKISTETTALLRKPFEFTRTHPHDGPCNHGTFSPQLESRAESMRSGLSGYGFGGSPPPTGRLGSSEGSRGMFGSLMEGVGARTGSQSSHKKKMSTTAFLAEQHGVKNTTTMYFPYYIPLLAWIPQYRWHHLQGDLVAALTMASFYLPMALSYAANLAHVPPINGLYSFVFNPLIYAILGSCPQMVVGPEAAGSLLVGSVIRSSVEDGKTPEWDDTMHAHVAGIVTGMAGAIIFIAGLTRLGFLDSVLSRPFLRGFISAIGFVILADQLIPEMGLAGYADKAGVSHGSSVDKLRFLFGNVQHASKITCLVSGVSFLIIMVCRETKKRLQPRYPSVAYVPDRFLVVVISAILCWQYRWDKMGLEILGEVKSTGGSAFSFYWPFQFEHMKHVREAMGTSFLIALLGFFESSVAAKSLGGGDSNKDGIEGIALSPNRELVALGVANLVGGCFGALPAFGGYGRSKVNASTGGKTPMSSVFLSFFSIICVLFMLPAFYYVPKAVLSAMITVVAWSLIEEAPHDILFFCRIRGWTELGLMTIIFAATIFYSLTLGIAIGVGLSLLSVIRHSTRPRIQILGRIPGTNRFENAEDNTDRLEMVEGCLIVKIPEPLTFANTGDLKNRLRRLELYGTLSAHPALPRVRHERHNKNVIFDIHGVTGLDGSGTQVLAEIVQNYVQRGVRVFFSRGPAEGTLIWELFERSGILENCGGRSHFVRDVVEALALSEMEEGGVGDFGYENAAGDEGGG